MPDLENPKLVPDLKIYKEGSFKRTDAEFKNKTGEIEKEKTMKEGRKKVEEALREGKIKFGAGREEVIKKPTFEEFKAQQESEFQKKLEAAREKKDAAYEDEKETAA